MTNFNIEKLKQIMEKNSVEKIIPIELDDAEDSVKKWHDTGNYAINYVMSKSTQKGFPSGRIITLVGDSSTGKTAFALKMGEADEIKIIIYFSSEPGAFETSFLKNFPKLKNKHLIYQPIGTVEEMMKELKAIIDWKKIEAKDVGMLVIIDSVANLTTEKEKEDISGYGGRRPLLLRQFFRTISLELDKNNITLVNITHYAIDPSIMYGDKRVMTGGRVIEYLSSLVLETKKDKDGTEYEKNTILGASKVGISVSVKKSRYGTMYMTIPIIMDVDSGFDNVSGLAFIAKELKIIKKKSENDKYYYLPGVYVKKGEINPRNEIDSEIDKAFFEKDFENILKENPEILNYVLDQIDKFNYSDEIDNVEKKQEEQSKKESKKKKSE